MRISAPGDISILSSHTIHHVKLDPPLRAVGVKDDRRFVADCDDENADTAEHPGA